MDSSETARTREIEAAGGCRQASSRGSGPAERVCGHVLSRPSPRPEPDADRSHAVAAGPKETADFNESLRPSPKAHAGVADKSHGVAFGRTYATGSFRRGRLRAVLSTSD